MAEKMLTPDLRDSQFVAAVFYESTPWSEKIFKPQTTFKDLI